MTVIILLSLAFIIAYAWSYSNYKKNQKYIEEAISPIESESLSDLKDSIIENRNAMQELSKTLENFNSHRTKAKHDKEITYLYYGHWKSFNSDVEKKNIIIGGSSTNYKEIAKPDIDKEFNKNVGKYPFDIFIDAADTRNPISSLNFYQQTSLRNYIIPYSIKVLSLH